MSQLFFMPRTASAAPPASAPQPAGERSIRTLLLWLVLACLLPGGIGATVLVMHTYQDGRAQLQQATLQTAHALAQTVDSRLLEAQSAALTLSTSGYLASSNLAAFHRQARQMLRKTGIPGYVVLSDEHGQALCNTLFAFGTPLPDTGNLAQVRSVFDSGKPRISDVYQIVANRPSIVSINVPVFSGKKIRYNLGIAIAPQYFQQILLDQHLPPAWVAAIVDQTGAVAAQVGEASSLPTLQDGAQLIRAQDEGTLTAQVGEAGAILSVFSSSPHANWHVVIGIPRQILEARLTHTVWVLALCTLILFSSGLGLAGFMGERIARSVRALSEAAGALGVGRPLKLARVHFREAAEVGAALRQTAQLLSDRTGALEQAHHTLQQREAELTNAQRIAHVGSWSWDASSGANSASQELCDVFGYDRLPPFAEQCGTLYTRATWRQLNAALQNALMTGTGYDLELPARHGSGRPMWIHTRCEAVCDDTGTVTGLRGTIQDITERRQAEQALLQSRAQLRMLIEHQEGVREEARKRIARDLHDELGQNLMGLRIDVSLMAKRRDLPRFARQWCEGMLGQIDAILKSVRAIMNDLRPAVLNLGLHAAVEWQVKEFERRTGIACKLHIDHDEFAMNEKCATALFRIIQEALTNIWRHAQARHARITMRRVDDMLFVDIADDGIGMATQADKPVPGFGLVGMQERISALGGRFSTVSEPGRGMTISVSLPLDADGASSAVAPPPRRPMYRIRSGAPAGALQAP